MIETAISLALMLGAPSNGRTIHVERNVVEEIKQVSGIDMRTLPGTATIKIREHAPTGTIEIIFWNHGGI